MASTVQVPAVAGGSLSPGSNVVGSCDARQCAAVRIKFPVLECSTPPVQVCRLLAPRKTAPTSGSAWTGSAVTDVEDVGGGRGAAAGTCVRAQSSGQKTTGNRSMANADRTRIMFDHA